MKKNILELCLSPDLGGLELCVADYFEYFAKREKNYLCIAPDKKLDKHIEHPNKFRLKRNRLFPIIPAFKLAMFIDKHGIDFIHFHWTKDIALAVLAKTLSRRKPKLMQSRHMSMTRFKDDFYHTWLYKNIDIMHAVTHQVKEQLEKFIPAEVRPRIEVVYLGVSQPEVDSELVESLRNKYKLQDTFVVGMVGRIEEGKGQYLLLEALAKLPELNIKALIVGAPMQEEYLEELKSLAKKLGIEERVVFTGFTKAVYEHINLS